jgi:single-stranded DNA-binding protein
MMTAAIYGRLGADPKRLETSNGKLMVVGSMAVTLPMMDEEHSSWIGLVEFGKSAEAVNRLGGASIPRPITQEAL